MAGYMALSKDELATLCVEKDENLEKCEGECEDLKDEIVSLKMKQDIEREKMEMAWWSGGTSTLRAQKKELEKELERHRIALGSSDEENKQLKDEIKQWAKLSEDRKIRMEKLRHYMMEFDLWHAFEDGLPDTRNAGEAVRLVRGLDLDNDTPGGRRVIMRMSATDSDSDSD